jgi:hypothetical protein
MDLWDVQRSGILEKRSVRAGSREKGTMRENECYNESRIPREGA